ncbi:MAG TPA: hypothetical protein VNO32_40660 [Candidatus Acidoferrum sp.]|nr:hypothetical protein [Candidatus Acidoferrum sp.]
MDTSEDLLERGFQLACFVIRERAAALDVVSGAANKLKARSFQEHKRFYWRDKHLKRHITKIAREEAATFQWLILLECEQKEIQQEKSGPVSEEELLLRYIKFLIRVTTGYSSFHVNVGLQRILYNLSASETQRIYESISDRYVGIDEYRRAKLAVMHKLRERFGNFLRTVRVGYGELRFEENENSGSWFGFVERCLEVFTPWTTELRCPPRLDSNERSAGDDNLESARCHLLIHPACKAELFRMLGIAVAGDQLAVPMFFRADPPGKSSPPTDRINAPLTAAERDKLSQHLVLEAQQRARISSGTLYFIADAVEYGWNPALPEAMTSFSIPANTETMEIWMEQGDSRLLLGIHLLRRNGDGTLIGAKAIVPVGRYGELRLAVFPSLAAESESATVSAECRADARRWWTSWKDLTERMNSVPRYASFTLAILVFASVLVTFFATQANVTNQRYLAKKQEELRVARQQVANLQRELRSQRDAANLMSIRLVPDELIVRGPAGPQFPSFAIPSSPGFVRLELPVSRGAGNRFRAELRVFSMHATLLSQDQLTPVRASTGQVLIFDCPNSALQSAGDYVVEVSMATKPGKRETIASFTFHARKLD